MRRLSTVGLVLLLLFALATPAWAQDAQTTEAFVVLAGRAHVPEGRQVGDLVVLHGSAIVDGPVDGSLTAFDAPVTIWVGSTEMWSCSTGGSSCARAPSSPATSSPNPLPVVAPGATIGGTRRRVQTNANWEGFGWAGRLAWWLAVSVSTLVVGLVLLWLVGAGLASGGVGRGLWGDRQHNRFSSPHGSLTIRRICVERACRLAYGGGRP